MLCILDLRHRRAGNRTFALVQCKCGRTQGLRLDTLKRGQKSCHNCAVRTHGHFAYNRASRTYEAWRSMKKRCYTPSNASYEQYSGRGITVCDRWINSFENFLEDMGECPEKLTLERSDNNSGYGPGNCVWADAKAQGRNRSTNKMTKEKVQEIRNSSLRYRVLADLFGASLSTIKDIRSGRTWKE